MSFFKFKFYVKKLIEITFVIFRTIPHFFIIIFIFFRLGDIIICK